MRNALLIVGLGFLILAVGWWYLSRMNVETAQNTRPDAPAVPTGGHEESPPIPVTESQGASIGSENEVEFTCTGGKTMTAVFTRDIVALTLSDGRQLTLRQAASASGIRYLNNTETIEFNGKGNDAFLTENGTTTYIDCKAVN
ncbi:hypothetical protein A2765_02995 [Candidatus Kaiserbacteria bacterium RIFCSPHIGHO2_01_FULL_56_24]|uniref:C-type lysozyme inhibitor domain-containing protein n=1 Tax=Candidatus Kaiserbacteria bacterium RIFCSPHIGHO2_01_FULL_56_24 TaxID=1798487 RepID=A0A1F6DGE3_9BACT|nr:MAG: hypothetical protein A2765_02995 [Candidatus Kaiserbacteria bacterium RIFCSPHIGHO2_01_FULL_56_24]